MSNVLVTTTITISYSDEDIRRLIVTDLRDNHNIDIAPSELRVNMSGGHLEEDDYGYSGGRINTTPRVVPPEFHGYKLMKNVTK